MKKIVFATDGSESSRPAAKMAAEFMEKWPEAELIAVYVTKIVAYPYDAVVPDMIMEHEDTLSTEIEHEIKDVQFAAFPGRVKYVHSVGNPVLTICDVADEQDADLIVIGSHGRGAVDRVMLGSVSHGVVNRTKRPIMVVRG